MRPLKVVLCVGKDEQLLSTRALQLDCWGYRVWRAENAAAARERLAALAASGLDLVMVHAPLFGEAELLAHVKAAHPEASTLVVGENHMRDRDCTADDWIAASEPAAELREKVRKMVARKRGPKRRPVQRPVQSDEHLMVLAKVTAKKPVQAERGAYRRRWA